MNEKLNKGAFLKNQVTILEMKNLIHEIKYSVENINSWLDQAEQSVNLKIGLLK